MNIVVVKVPHSNQRYPTVGDWKFYDLYQKILQVNVSNMENEDYEFLVAVHEIIEAYLCKKRGIKEEDVSDFDIAYEASRLPNMTDEPGNNHLAPYHKEHVFATAIEKQIADELGVNWEEYDAVVNSL